MTENTTPTDTNYTDSNLAVEYAVEPIRIRDPVAEALTVLEPGDPFVIPYEDVVKAAGHSCPTAAGAYRIVQLGLNALYPNELPVRSEVAILAAGQREDATYGVMGRLISFVTGAAQEGGFSGLAGGHGDRQNMLTFDAFTPKSANPTFRLRRSDTGKIVQVTYNVDSVPEGGPSLSNLQQIIDGTASEEEYDRFAEKWHDRVQSVLSDDSLFTVTTVE